MNFKKKCEILPRDRYLAAGMTATASPLAIAVLASQAEAIGAALMGVVNPIEPVTGQEILRQPTGVVKSFSSQAIRIQRR